MSATRDPDRLLRAWLDLMPDEAPDRAIAAVLQATTAAPQVRGLRWFGPWRSPMSRFTLIAATALLMAALAGGLWILTSGGDQPESPSTSPTTQPTIIPTVGDALPPELLARWFGGTRTLPGLEAGAGTTMVFREGAVQPNVVSVTQSNQQNDALLGGFAGIVDGRINVGKGNEPTDCADADVGSYAYSLSASAETLTISDAQDPCASRQAALVGTWWRADCKIGQITCLGALDAGTYGSEYLRPVLGGQPWAPKYGGLTFTVPDGWANDSDWPSSFTLTQLADFEASATGEGSPKIFVGSQIQAAAQGPDRCTNTPATGVAVTADAVIDHLRGIPGLVVDDGEQIDIDGHSATWLDLTVDAATVNGCADSGEKIVEFLLFGGEGYALGTPGIDRVILVDLGGHDLVAISVEAPDQAALDAFWPKALPTIESFQFE
jgi:hypothetical protein